MVWSESPVGRPNARRRVAITPRFACSCGSGYALTHCKSTTSGSGQADRIVAIASSTSPSVQSPVEQMSGLLSPRRAEERQVVQLRRCDLQCWGVEGLDLPKRLLVERRAEEVEPQRPGRLRQLGDPLGGDA